VLTDLIPSVRAALTESGPLRQSEMDEFAARDMARGQKCTAPALGRVAGITASGELLITLADSVARFRSGSLVLERD
jgi:hypothetical protein